MNNTFDITDFGAVGDGVFDCTQAIQAALDAAGAVRGAVLVPPGEYRSGQLIMQPHTCLSGTPAWSFSENGASTLILKDEHQPCLLDITGAVGCTVRGLCLEGNELGSNTHGVLLENESFGFFRGVGEDTPTIEDCRVANFSGNAVHLECAWCFNLRRNMLAHSGGSGVFLSGCDGFFSDNWFTDNKQAGLYIDCIGSALSLTNNRVEWNHEAGFFLRGAESVQCTGNYFDRTRGPAIDMANEEGQMSESINITGNIFKRSGERAEENSPQDSHIHMERCVNICVTGNTFRVGGGDGFNENDRRSPNSAIVLKHLRGAVIANNAMHCGGMVATILDLGEHEDEVLLAQNAGLPSGETSHWLPKLDQ